MSHPVDSPRNHLPTLSVSLPSRFAVGWLKVLQKNNGERWFSGITGYVGPSSSHLRSFGAHLGAILATCGAENVEKALKTFRKRGFSFTMGYVEASSSHLRSLGQLGAVLWPSWGRIGAILGPSWAHLGAILSHLKAIWAFFSDPKTIKRDAQKPTKT